MESEERASVLSRTRLDFVLRPYHREVNRSHCRCSRSCCVRCARVTQEHGAIGKHTPRMPGVERTKYVLTDVALVEAKVEGDQDVHLAIQDKQGEPTDHMIVEFPNVACNVNAPTRYKNQIAKARSDVVDLTRECRTGFKKGWAQFRPGTTATIRGVGFFDLVHGSELLGVTENEVELHPVLAFHAPVSPFSKGASQARFSRGVFFGGVPRTVARSGLTAFPWEEDGRRGTPRRPVRREGGQRPGAKWG